MKVIQWQTAAMVVTVLTRGRLPWSNPESAVCCCSVLRMLVLTASPGACQLSQRRVRGDCTSAGDGSAVQHEAEEARLLLH